MGAEYTNLALLTDGLRAEREQGITIDVAYRYFATPKRKFIIADTPGHIQYTRNMVTGASTADLALVLVDARNGIVEQSPPPRVPRLAAARSRTSCCASTRWTSSTATEDALRARSRTSSSDFAAKLDISDLTFVPISALHGDNVVDRSANMPWYEGSSLLHHLEEVHIASDRNLIDARFPVQYVHPAVIDEYHDYRGYAGTVAGGVFKPGDEVDRPAVGLHLDDQVDRHGRRAGRRGVRADVGHGHASTTRSTSRRGDMICRPHNQPTVGQDIDAMVCWMTEQSTLAPRHEARDQAHHPLGPGAGQGPALPARRQHAAPRRGRRACAQRDRPGQPAHHAAAVLRRVPPQPRRPAASS